MSFRELLLRFRRVHIAIGVVFVVFAVLSLAICLAWTPGVVKSGCDFDVDVTTGTCGGNTTDDAEAYVCYNVHRTVMFYRRPFFRWTLRRCTALLNDTLYDAGSEHASQLLAWQDYESLPPTNSVCFREKHTCALRVKDDYQDAVEKAHAVKTMAAYFFIGLLCASAIVFSLLLAHSHMTMMPTTT